jgi:hypothetical protein
MCVGAHVNS